MGFQVIPSVDVAGGRLGRLTANGPVPIDGFGGDPLAAAEAFVEAGARWIHVVDMDLAFAGEARNLDVVRRIAALPVLVQASGGIVTEAEAETALEAGAARVVLGSGAFADREGSEALVARFRDVLAIGVEAEGSRVRPRGRAAVDLPLAETVAWLAGVGAARFVHTQVARVGGLEGPDLDGVAALASATGRPVIASGGIRSVDDLRALARLGPGVEGAIVGRALSEGLDLREALTAASSW